MTAPLSRRTFLSASFATLLLRGEESNLTLRNVHQQLIELVKEQEKKRRERFAAVKTPGELESLQKELREKFLVLLGGLPEVDKPPPVKKTGRVEADDYTIDKLVYESLPGYFVSALLYLPAKQDKPVPGILSPCGHSAAGKADPTYQTLHINLAKRGFAVLTYDPVGQGERSQFWDSERQRSRFNLTCGEHAVLGNPLYLLGGSLARYRIWDGMRGIDYLSSLPEVDAKRIGCVGNSGGGTLTAYISALDSRVVAAVPSCFITTLPRRMANRIQKDADADPEQDIFGFVSEGIDHAGLLAMRVPRPTLLGTAVRDFFPIEGARESFDEAKKLYETAGVGDRIAKVEADAGHGLSLTLRQAAYAWFDRWLFDRKDEPREQELKVTPRPAKDLLVCAAGQVNVTFRSRHLFPLALEGFKKGRVQHQRSTLKELIAPDPECADFRLTRTDSERKTGGVLILFVNGIDSDWASQKKLLAALAKKGIGASIVDPRGVGQLRPAGLEVKGHAYADPLCGVEENIAYNAFLVGKSLVGMRVTDVLKAAAQIRSDASPSRLILCGKRDSALIACLAAATEPSIDAVAVEEMALSLQAFFDPAGKPISAASILPGMLSRFGDVAEVLTAIAPRKVLAAAATGEPGRKLTNLDRRDRGFCAEPDVLLDWLKS
jgi:dienelactone hydrolase